MAAFQNYEVVHYSSRLPLKYDFYSFVSISGHWHNALELILVLEGSVTVNMNDRTFSLKPDDLILINFNCPHCLQSDSAVILSLKFGPELFFLRDDTSRPPSFECCSAGDERKERFDSIRFIVTHIVYSARSHTSYGEYHTMALCCHLISFLHEHFLGPDEQNTEAFQKDFERLNRILQYIQEHYAENLSLQDLAEQEGLSYAYLSSFFSSHMGMTFKQYSTDIKLDHAKRELQDTDESIEAISLRHGFNDTHSFIRAFKKKYEVLPSVYRKTHRELMPDAGEHSLYRRITVTDGWIAYMKKYIQDDSVPVQLITSSEKTLQLQDIPVTRIQRTLSHQFTKMISVTRASDLMDPDIRNMLLEARNVLHYEYVGLHALFCDDMAVCTRSPEGALRFGWHRIDSVLDYITGIGMKPYLQLSYMPAALAENPGKTIFFPPICTSPPKKQDEWNSLVRAFLRHLQERYGLETLKTWPMNIWNEPDSPPEIFGFESFERFLGFYVSTFRTIRRFCPDFLVGTPSLYFNSKKSTAQWIQRFLRAIIAQYAIPDFLDVSYYANILPEGLLDSESQGPYQYPENEDDFSLFIDRCASILKSCRVPRMPVYLTAWNFSVQKDPLNDNCFKSCYIAKNLLENYDRLRSFGYWSLTDRTGEELIPEQEFHGGLGMYTAGGLKKNVFYVFRFISLLGNELLDNGKWYFITRSDAGIQIITWHYIHYNSIYAHGKIPKLEEDNSYSVFDLSARLSVTIPLTDLRNGHYRIREFSINREYGSAFDLWLKMGAEQLTPDEMQILEKSVAPRLSLRNQLVRDCRLTYTATLEPLEVRLALIEYREEP